MTRGRHGLLRPRCALFANVANGGDTTAGDLEKVLEVAAALQADADHPDPDERDRRRGEQRALGGRRRTRAGRHGRRRAEREKLPAIDVVHLLCLSG
jgi:hypothetical protein